MHTKHQIEALNPVYKTKYLTIHNLRRVTTIQLMNFLKNFSIVEIIFFITDIMFDYYDKSFKTCVQSVKLTVLCLFRSSL